MVRPLRQIAALILASATWPAFALAQDLEPRRWAHLPVGLNVAGLGYGYTRGDVSFNPVLELTNVEVESQTAVVSYVRSINVFGKTGRLDLFLPFQSTRWSGLLSGSTASTDRLGLADPLVRMSVNLVGAPALTGKAYRDHRAAHPVSTVAGAAVSVSLPLGEYESSRLLNLGQNRFSVRPQIGFVHTRGSWAYELTGSAVMFTDNDDFFGDARLEQDAIYAIQTHVIHAFPNRWWISVSAGYNWGGETYIDDVPTNNERRSVLAALTLGLPIGENQALKFAYVRGDALRRIGVDANSLVVAWSIRF